MIAISIIGPTFAWLSQVNTDTIYQHLYQTVHSGVVTCHTPTSDTLQREYSSTELLSFQASQGNTRFAASCQLQLGSANPTTRAVHEVVCKLVEYLGVFATRTNSIYNSMDKRANNSLVSPGHDRVHLIATYKTSVFLFLLFIILFGFVFSVVAALHTLVTNIPNTKAMFACWLQLHSLLDNSVTPACVALIATRKPLHIYHPSTWNLANFIKSLNLVPMCKLKRCWFALFGIVVFSKYILLAIRECGWRPGTCMHVTLT